MNFFILFLTWIQFSLTQNLRYYFLVSVNWPAFDFTTLFKKQKLCKNIFLLNGAPLPWDALILFLCYSHWNNFWGCERAPQRQCGIWKKLQDGWGLSAEINDWQIPAPWSNNCFSHNLLSVWLIALVLLDWNKKKLEKFKALLSFTLLYFCLLSFRGETFRNFALVLSRKLRMEMTHVRKVRVMYITDPGSDKPRPVYVTPTSQANTFQILPYTVVTTTAANSAPTVQHYVFTEASTASAPAPPPQPAPPSIPVTAPTRPPPPQSVAASRVVYQKAAAPTMARRALMPQRRNLVKNVRLPLPKFSRDSTLPLLPAPFDLPEIKEFLLKPQNLPLLTATYVDEYFKEVEGMPPIVSDNFNVHTLNCPMMAPPPVRTTTTSRPMVQQQASASSSRQIQNPSLATSMIYRASEQRNAPKAIRKPPQT